MAYLTLLRGGVFGNDWLWIAGAMRRALLGVQDTGLDVRIVSYSTPSQDLLELAEELAPGI